MRHASLSQFRLIGSVGRDKEYGLYGLVGRDKEYGLLAFQQAVVRSILLLQERLMTQDRDEFPDTGYIRGKGVGFGKC
jgi:hypothetical protein